MKKLRNANIWNMAKFLIDMGYARKKNQKSSKFYLKISGAGTT